jgi:hypothetical protein
MCHGDLAIIAAEHDNLECLKFILEELEDEDIKIPKLKVINGPNCEHYIKKLNT